MLVITVKEFGNSGRGKSCVSRLQRDGIDIWALARQRDGQDAQLCNVGTSFRKVPTGLSLTNDQAEKLEKVKKGKYEISKLMNSSKLR